MEVRHALLSCPLLRRLPLAACRSRARAPPSTARRPAARKVLQHLVYARSAHEELLQQQDCYPTEIKYVGTTLFAQRREDGQWIAVPPQKIERNRDNPDGRNHVCMPPP